MKKTLTVALAFVLVIAMSVAGTFAYLTSQDTVTNTFTVGKLFDGENGGMMLKEHEVTQDKDGTYVMPDGAAVVDGNTYENVLPGSTNDKDPFVQITGMTDNVTAYLFVTVSKDDNVDFTVDSTNWTETELKAKDGGTVYVYKNGATVDKTVTDPIYIIKDNVITINDVAADTEIADVVFNAYLCQTAGFTSAEAAWNANFAPATGA